MRSYFANLDSKAQNLARKLREEYDAVLAQYDVLLMPTLPFTAPAIPGKESSREEYVAKVSSVPHEWQAFDMLANTAAFDATGHPAMTIPCGEVDGMPAGMMLVGRHWDETTIYRFAYAYEQKK